jgi:hypothetical protein
MKLPDKLIQTQSNSPLDNHLLMLIGFSLLSVDENSYFASYGKTIIFGGVDGMLTAFTIVTGAIGAFSLFII